LLDISHLFIEAPGRQVFIEGGCFSNYIPAAHVTDNPVGLFQQHPADSFAAEIVMGGNPVKVIAVIRTVNMALAAIGYGSVLSHCKDEAIRRMIPVLQPVFGQLHCDRYFTVIKKAGRDENLPHRFIVTRTYIVPENNVCHVGVYQDTKVRK
jgi:hypothetical protein